MCLGVALVVARAQHERVACVVDCEGACHHINTVFHVDVARGSRVRVAVSGGECWDGVELDQDQVVGVGIEAHLVGVRVEGVVSAIEVANVPNRARSFVIDVERPVECLALLSSISCRTFCCGGWRYDGFHKVEHSIVGLSHGAKSLNPIAVDDSSRPWYVLPAVGKGVGDLELFEEIRLGDPQVDVPGVRLVKFGNAILCPQVVVQQGGAGGQQALSSGPIVGPCLPPILNVGS